MCFPMPIMTTRQLKAVGLLLAEALATMFSWPSATFPPIPELVSNPACAVDLVEQASNLGRGNFWKQS